MLRIGEFYAEPKGITDLRCDLHPRWDNDSKRKLSDAEIEMLLKEAKSFKGVDFYEN